MTDPDINPDKMYLYFLPVRFRKAECCRCRAITPKHSRERHALWHVRKDGFEPNVGRGFGSLAFSYVTVTKTASGNYESAVTGWVVSDPNPLP